MELDINTLDNKTAIVSTDMPMWKNRFLKWAQQYPEEVIVKSHPETNDGNLVAQFPASWIKGMRPKRKYSEEQRAIMAARLNK